MKPQTNTMTAEDTFDGDEIEFTIGDPGWVMRALADLYSDRTMAVIREYSTNAYDAHVMAGLDEPIHVTLPSMMDPFFVVEDRGVGMSAATLTKFYTAFGKSDKRESNDSNGMLGFGCKAGVAYTDQFTVSTVKDGVETHAIVYRKPDWTIAMKAPRQAKTDKPNGTRVKIPVNNIEEFNTKARDFYSFWLPNRVLVNGETPRQNVGKKITENLYYSPSYSNSYLVMGNVAYRVTNPDLLFRNTKMNAVKFVAYVDDLSDEDGAAVEFTNSREDLKYTDKTKATLAKVISDFTQAILSDAQKDIDGAKDHFEAYLKWCDWTNTLGSTLFADFEFKGAKFHKSFPVNGQRYSTSGYYGRSVQWIRSHEVEKVAKTLFITDYDPTTVGVPSAHRTKAREYIAVKQMNPNIHYIFMKPGEQVFSPWVDKTRFVSWADLKAALPKKVRDPNSYNRVPRRVSGSFDYWTKSGFSTEKPVPTDKATNLMYITVKSAKMYDVSSILYYLDVPDACVIRLPANRAAKFKRDFPHVKEFISEATEKHITLNGADLLSEDARIARNLDSMTRSWMQNLSIRNNDILDPEWKRANELRKKGEQLTQAYDNNEQAIRLLRVWGRYTAYDGTQIDLAGKYPLLQGLARLRTDLYNEVVEYMNLVFAKRGN